MNGLRQIASWSWTVVGIVGARARHGLRPCGLRPFAFVGLCAALGVAGLLPARVSAELSTPASSVEQVAPEDKIELRHVSGPLVMVRKNKISVEYATEGTTSSEILLPLAKDGVTLEGIHAFEQLKPGDVVDVTYEEHYRDGEQPGERVYTKTVATTIRLVKTSTRTDSSGGP